MEISAICFTEQGYEQVRKLKRLHTSEPKLRCFYKMKKAPDLREAAQTMPENRSPEYVTESLQEWTGKQFARKSAILFIGAAGIAVRAIAPFVKDKLSDVPVLVMDDAGQYVIPILSGHMGGANELARQIAGETGAVPVITTSTDVHRVFAADVFAKKNRLHIVNREGIAAVSAKALRQETILIGISEEIKTDPKSASAFEQAWKGQVRVLTVPAGPDPADEKEKQKAKQKAKQKEIAADVYIGKPKVTNVKALLYLEQRDYVLGVGCRKGKTASELISFITEKLASAGLCWSDLDCMASVDIKKEEPGLMQLSAEKHLEFRTFTSEELEAVPGDFAESEFVRSQVGTGSVAERAAVAAAGGSGKIIIPKQAKDGMTMAVVQRGDLGICSEITFHSPEKEKGQT